MNPGFQRLAAYPFERLAVLKQGLTPPAHLSHIPLSIGEPRHEPPAFVIDTLRKHLADLGSYPATRGLPELRHAAARWTERRWLVRSLAYAQAQEAALERRLERATAAESEMVVRKRGKKRLFYAELMLAAQGIVAREGVEGLLSYTVRAVMAARQFVPPEFIRRRRIRTSRS